MSGTTDSLRKFVDEYQRLTEPILLNKINFVELASAEALVEKDAFYKDAFTNLTNLIKDLRIDDVQRHIAISTLVSEISLYQELRRRGVDIRRVIAGKVHGKKNPDYEVKIDDRVYFAELKSIQMVDGNLKYRRILEDGLQARIDEEESGSSIMVIQPIIASGDDYDPSSYRDLIKVLIRKVRSSVKPGQFALGTTLLCIDVRQFPLGGNPEEVSRELFTCRRDGDQLSGVLWHTAFRQLDTTVYSPILGVPGKTRAETLDELGILYEFPCVSGLCFRVESMPDEAKLVGFCLGSRTDAKVVLDKMCDIVVVS